MSTRSRSRSLTAVALASALVVAACGSDDAATDEAAEAPSTDAPVEEADEEVAEEPAEEEAPAEEPEAEEPAEEPVEEVEATESLLIWADEQRVAPLEAIAPSFTEATGIELQIELVPFDDIREQVTQAGPAGEGPDVFAGAHDWTGELAANGVIDPIDLGGSEDQFLSVALQGFNFEGQNYAIPYATEAIALYRNTDLVADAPATWDDLLAGCDAAALANCVVLPGGGDGADAYHNYPFVSAFGGFIFEYSDDAGFDASVVGLDDPATVEGISFLEAQVTSGSVAATNYDTAKNLFLGGEAPFWITGPWELGGTREQTEVAFDVSLIPQIGDAPAQPFTGAQGFFLSAFSENELLAQSFLLDFIATDETMSALYDADPRGTAWVAQQATLADDPQVAVFSESAANGIPMPNIPQMGSVWGPLGDNLLLVRNAELAADEAMTTAADAVRSAVEG